MILRSILLLLVSVSSASAALPPGAADRIEAEIAGGRWVGLSIAVIDGDTSQTYHFGHLTLDGKDRPSDNTQYEIGSITKAFTGITLACGVARGWVSLDDPISRYLPANIRIKDPKVAAITLLELATHTSGLPRLPGNLVPRDPQDPYRDYDVADLIAYLGAFAPSADLDKGYEYSNLGSGLLGYLLGRASSGDYQKALQTCVLDPLQMEDTTLVPSEDQRARLSAPHHQGEQVKNWSLDVLAGAGALYSTPADMLRFSKAMLAPEKTPIAEVLKASMQEHQSTGQPGGAVGLGWHLEHDQEKGRSLVWHNGGTGGYASAMFLDHHNQRAVVVLGNSTSDVTALARSILDNRPPPEPSEPITLPVEELTAYLGWFEFFDGFRVHLTIYREQLHARATGQTTLALDALGDDRFSYQEVEAQLQFHRDQQGKVVSVVLYQHGQKIAARRIEPPTEEPDYSRIELDPETLAGYQGVFKLNDALSFDVRVNEHGELSVQLTDQPRFECYAYQPERFYFEVADAQITFQRDAAGQVNALVLHQNGIDQRAEKTSD